MCDEFTPSQVGIYNRNNLIKSFNVDLIDFRISPRQFIEHTRQNFFEELQPLKWVEEQLYRIPIETAKSFDIPTLFMGENSAFEYGEDEECKIFHPASSEQFKIIFTGSIWPYSNSDSLSVARKIPELNF